MNTEEFLNSISDAEGPLQGTAAEVLEQMSKDDFVELCQDMKWLVDLCMVYFGPKITFLGNPSEEDWKELRASGILRRPSYRELMSKIFT